MKEKLCTIKNRVAEFGDKRYNLIMVIAFIALFSYLFNCTIRTIIYKSEISVFIAFFIAGICMLTANLKYINKYSIVERKKLILVLLFFAFLICFRNGDIINSHFGLPFYSVFTLYMIFVLSFSNKWFPIARNVLLIFVGEHVIATLFCYMFPEFYYNNIMPLFPDYQSELMYQFNHNQIAGLTQHYSTNAIYLCIGFIVMTFSLKIDFKNKKATSILQIIFYFLIIFALLLTGKRAQVVFPIIAILIVFILKNRKNIILAIKKIAMVVIVAVVLILALSQLIPSITNSFTRTISALTDSSTMDTRTPLYELALTKFKEKPILGWGWGNYKYIYNEEMEVKERDYLNTHCIYLQMLCEVGIIGTIFICSIFIYLLVKNLKLIIKNDCNGKSNVYYLFLAFHIYFLLEGVFGNSLYDIYTFLLYGVICALFINEMYSQKEEKNK